MAGIPHKFDVDSNYWKNVHEKHFDHLLLLACNKLTDGDMDKAQELVSEAFVRAIRYAKPEGLEDIGGYLWKVVTRVSITQCRKEQAAITDRIDYPTTNAKGSGSFRLIATDPDSPSAWTVLRSMSGTLEGPTDWSQELDHYLYGTPKRSESNG